MNIKLADHKEVIIKNLFGKEETIRIPVSEERIEAGKHTMVTGEVVAHKREVEETKQVKETLKRQVTYTTK